MVPLFSMNKSDRIAARAFNKLTDAQKNKFVKDDGTRMSDTEIIDSFKGMSKDQLQNYLNMFLNPTVIAPQPIGFAPLGAPPTAPVLMQPPK